MQRQTIQRILGLLLMVFSVSMLPPIGVSWIYNDGAGAPFFLGFMITLITGGAIWWPVRRVIKDFMLLEQPRMSFTDAFFESLSGLTTTGATVITGIDHLPHAILFYRQQLQWLGGMGIIVLAVAILPMLGVGGMQLYRAETPGPMKDNKLTPRITETAKALWYIYLGLTVLCAAAYWWAGMSAFDAIGHSFATVAIGGFSTHDASMGYFNNPLIEAIAIFFMLIAGINFALHFLAWRGLSLKPYVKEPESLTYLTILGTVSVVTVAYLYYMGIYANLADAARHGIFQAISIGTTTGFTTAEYYYWPGFLPVLLLLVSFIGGCAGSAGGGMKVI
ncbi:MAG: trk system potassium uptake protein TrkH, partial [Halothiobacillaceae bacterium]